MKKVFVAAGLVTLLLSANALAGALTLNWGAEDVNKSIECTVNKVPLLAKTDADCKAAGGVAVAAVR